MLPRSIARWIEHEQLVNDRIINLERFARLDESDLRPELAPEAQPIWPQQMVAVPKEHARVYFFAAARVRRELGVHVPPGTVPVFLHPQPPPADERLIRRFGSRDTGYLATPTAS